ncbi:FAD-binding oxidoreductase (plasmid) [Rhizobium sp. T1473]|uniref:FAD-binding oxidoreductase n=1 Tax=Rhizobium sp. T1473 TaxID=555321 RepID=UPI0030D40FC1
MRSRQEWRQARVIDIAHPTEDVRAVTFAVNGPLSAFDPGSHTNIRVMIHDAPAIRTYTVLPSAPGTLKIAVKLHPNSRGGSAWVWSLNPGDVTEMTTPENRFELSWRASHYLLIAGGIGVTPIFGMAPALISGGQSVRMIYGGRSQAQLAFRDEWKSRPCERPSRCVQTRVCSRRFCNPASTWSMTASAANVASAPSASLIMRRRLTIATALVHGSGLERIWICDGAIYVVGPLRRMDLGRAHASIRLRAAQPMATSVC